MTVQRMDHVGIVVDDLAAATGFFTELGLEVRGEATVSGDWVDRVVGLEGVESDIAMLQTPDGHNRIELVSFRSPPHEGDAGVPSNHRGLRHLSFAVDDLDDAIARLRTRGGELVGEVESYKDAVRVCYLRGPEGIIVELAETIG